jgi:hypothetical protein
MEPGTKDENVQAPNLILNIGAKLPKIAVDNEIGLIREDLTGCRVRLLADNSEFLGLSTDKAKRRTRIDQAQGDRFSDPLRGSRD